MDGGYWSRQLRALVPFGWWAAYGLLFAGHVFVRSLGDEWLPWKNPGELDSALTGTNPSLWLQERLYGDSKTLLDRLTTGAHLGWFAFPIVIGIGVTVLRRELLVRYLAWLTAGWFACDLLFLLFPATPPWMVDGEVTRVLFTRGWIEYVEYDSNPVAAFPSLHACVPVLVGLFAWTYVPGRRSLAWASWLFAALVGFSVVYLGEHWIVDVAAGAGVAGLLAAFLRLPAVEHWLSIGGALPARGKGISRLPRTVVEGDIAA